MTRKSAMIKKLAVLTEAVFQAKQANLQAKAAAEAACMHALVQLDKDREKVTASLQLNEGMSGAQIACQSQWLVWAEKERATRNMALARARAVAMDHRKAAKKAFGRHNATQSLVSKLP
ncbi:MAG: hypothetical protein ACJAQW_000980 [Paracoccaceae bacterium]|jgi:hypothetical protein